MSDKWTEKNLPDLTGKTIIITGLVLLSILTIGCVEVDSNQAIDMQGDKIEIDMYQLKDVMPTTTYEEQEAIALIEFIALANPEQYTYRVVASDGYSPDPFSYEDIQNGYWLLDIDQTFFPENNLGSTRLREPRTIIPLLDKE